MPEADFVIIVPPFGIKNTIYPPYGAMYIASAVREKGYKPAIINVDTGRVTNREVVEIIRGLRPKYIGFSGIVAPSYKYIKELSKDIKDALPDRIQILGGGLSSAAEPILKNTPIDFIVQGEGDITIVELLESLEKGKDPSGVMGIYRRCGTEFASTGVRRLIARLDDLPYPAFDLVDMERYMPDGREFINYFSTKIKDKRILDPKRKRRMITIPTSRGCFGKCTFCFRAYPGLRTHSMKYVFDLIEHCIEKFDAGFFSLGDECFAPNKEHNWEFIEEFKKRKLDIVFRILGMRVDTVDRDILQAYKEIGCWMIQYGFEAGNQRILNIIDKRVTVEQNRQVALWTNEAGIFTSPTLVLAMPGETDSTINESIGFLKSLDFGYKQYQWSYALPVPGAPLYDFAKLCGAIQNEDEYLSSLDGKVGGAGVFHINLTDVSDDIAAGWADRIKNELDAYYFKRKYIIPLFAVLIDIIKKAEIHIRRGDLLAVLKNKLRSKPSEKPGQGKTTGTGVRFHKRKDIVVEDLIKGLDNSVVNREMSLKRISARLLEKISAEKGPPDIQ